MTSSVTPRKYSSEEKIRIVIVGMRGDTSIAELCRREGIAQNLHYRWSKDFMESGRKRLDVDTMREAKRCRPEEIPTPRKSQSSVFVIILSERDQLDGYGTIESKEYSGRQN